VRVREIWVGNLPESITKEVLYSHFFISGEIDDIELLRQNKSYPFYAFIRFKLSNCAKRAYDLGQSLEIDGMRLKVQFSDYNKRPSTIQGDIPDYDLT
jgi:RNA recognition motif-containing protein